MGHREPTPSQQRWQADSEAVADSRTPVCELDIAWSVAARMSVPRVILDAPYESDGVVIEERPPEHDTSDCISGWFGEDLIERTLQEH